MKYTYIPSNTVKKCKGFLTYDDTIVFTDEHGISAFRLKETRIDKLPLSFVTVKKELRDEIKEFLYEDDKIEITL